MKLAIFSPYGAVSREAGLLYLIANYLAKRGADVAQLNCDGALPVCARSRGSGLARSPFECASCMREQRELALWAGIATRDVSTEIVGDDISQTANWLRSVSREALTRVEFRGLNLWSLCRGEFLSHWPEVDVGALNFQQEAYLRGLFASSVRAAVASDRFLERLTPKLSLVASPGDPVAGAYAHECVRRGIDTAVFQFDVDSEALNVELLNTGQAYTTRLVLEGITSMRSDPRTWGAEVTAVVHEVLTLLGLAPDRVV